MQIVEIDASIPRLGPIIVKRGREDAKQMATVTLCLFNDPLQPIDHVLLVLVTFKHVKGVQDVLILVLDELLEDLDVLGVLNVLPGQTVDKVHQLLLALGEWALGSFQIWI